MLPIAGLVSGILSNSPVGGDATPITSGADSGTGGMNVGSTNKTSIRIEGQGNSASASPVNTAVRNGPEPVGGPVYGPALNATAGFPIEKAMLYGVILIIALGAMKTMRGK